MIDQIAHVVTVYRRQRAAQRLVDSILRRWPGARIYVCDDSPEPTTYEGAKDVPAGNHDIGAAAKRNVLFEAAEEPYVMIYDEDFLVTDATDLVPFWAVIQSLDDVGIVCGELRHPENGRPTWFTGDLFVDGVVSRIEGPGPPQTLQWDGKQIRYNRVDIGLQWFLADRETLRLVPWDEDLKQGEHIELFARLAAVRAQNESRKDWEKWRSRYERRARGKVETDLGRVEITAKASFSNKKHLSDLPQNSLTAGETAFVPVSYARELEEAGLAQMAVPVLEGRPLEIPENPPLNSSRTVPTGVALVPDTTAIHDKRTQWPEQYKEFRGRTQFHERQHSKMGTLENQMPDWSEYPHGEPEWPSRDWDALLEMPR